MARRPARSRPSPLPMRDGIKPGRITLPPGAQFPTAAAYLAARFPGDAAGLPALLAAGAIVTASGIPVTAATPYRAHEQLFTYRPLSPEPPVPGSLEILHQDSNLVVVDKPHFLTTAPRGRHVSETALVRLRRELDNPELAPAHRLDRLTAGVLVFTARPEVRGAYQGLFAQRAVQKFYEAVIAVPGASLIPGSPASAALPSAVSNRLRKDPAGRQVRSVVDPANPTAPPNARTDISTLWWGTAHAGLRLQPHTGHYHQLRVHLSELGFPIVGDDLYPQPRERAADDFSAPLQLLARSITFTDPLDGSARRFVSNRQLDLWQR